MTTRTFGRAAEVAARLCRDPRHGGQATGDVIERNLFTGITKVRPGAGIAVVGTPEQCAETLQDFIDLGCHSFCLSGYLHDEEAERFGKWVMPILRHRNRQRMLAA